MDSAALLSECTYQTSRSGGPGGQHANKVETQVTLRFNVAESEMLSLWQKDMLRKRLESRLSQQEEIVLSCNETRSQLRNKELVQARFVALIEQAVKPPKVRKKRRLSQAAREKRLDSKKRRSQKKQWRKPPSW